MVRSFEFVCGRWVPPATGATIDVISPVTEQRLATVPEASTDDVDAAVAAARGAFDEGPWPRMSPVERADALRRVGEEVQKRIPEMVASFTAEIGAPRMISEAFHANATAMWDDAATLHERVAFEERRSWDGGSALIVREPVGVVATIIPWNGPVATASPKISPALAAGCPVVLKPAPEGPVSTPPLAEALEAAGLPRESSRFLPAGREVGEHLVRHPGVDKVSFTGSTAAGRRIMSICGERIARVTLELGGKSAGIVCDDIPTAVPHLRARGGGSMVFTSSIGGLKGIMGVAHYVSAKHGLVGLMRTMANELGKERIRVTTVHPTNVDTHMIQNPGTWGLFAPDDPEPTQEKVTDGFRSLNAIPVPWVDPVDIANAVLFLSSNEARYVTGVALPVDAGASVR